MVGYHWWWWFGSVGFVFVVRAAFGPRGCRPLALVRAVVVGGVCARHMRGLGKPLGLSGSVFRVFLYFLCGLWRLLFVFVAVRAGQRSARLPFPRYAARRCGRLGVRAPHAWARQTACPFGTKFRKLRNNWCSLFPQQVSRVPAWWLWFAPLWSVGGCASQCLQPGSRLPSHRKIFIRVGILFFFYQNKAAGRTPEKGKKARIRFASRRFIRPFLVWGTPSPFGFVLGKPHDPRFLPPFLFSLLYRRRTCARETRPFRSNSPPWGCYPSVQLAVYALPPHRRDWARACGRGACASVILTPVKYNGGLNYFIAPEHPAVDAVQAFNLVPYPAQSSEHQVPAPEPGNVPSGEWCAVARLNFFCIFFKKKSTIFKMDLHMLIIFSNFASSIEKHVRFSILQIIRESINICELLTFNLVAL